jgi:6-pyruvoyl-tetrahydropterin synthase
MLLFVDNLTNLDFSYLDPKRGLVGETWLASIELEGELDEQGMVLDFGEVKKRVKRWFDDNIDHKLVIPIESKALNFQERHGLQHLRWRYDLGELHSYAPAQAHCLLPLATVERESCALWCEQALKALLPKSVLSVNIRFEPENIEGAFYHYSHGLKKHAGNCQRICHGHRSRIEISRNGKRDLALESSWAAQWRDIYIASEADLVSESEDVFEFNYQAEQGDFFLSLPRDSVYFIDSDSTVELIAAHIARELKRLHPDDSFQVRAFEGLEKGAIVAA